MLKVVLNSDDEIVNEIRKSLKDNDNYCPCRIEKIPDNKCMCKEFREQKTPGECHCGLYVKVEV